MRLISEKSDFTKSHLGRFIFSHNEAVVDLGEIGLS